MHDEWRQVHGSAPIESGGETYWYAVAQIFLGKDGRIRDAALALKGPMGSPQRLSIVEAALVDGKLDNADAVLDAVKDIVECNADEYGSAAAKSYIAGWLCADVVGRCLK